MKKRAIISVSDKTGITEAAKRLEKLGYEIISTGGTYKLLKENGINVTGVSSITGFPECLDGRVKTLHPAIHAGILAMRDNDEHMKTLEELDISPVDVVIVNLYPFRKTVMNPESTFEDAVENIDIGGPSMLRAAAKNYKDVMVLIDPEDYEKAFSQLESGEKDLGFRKYLMFKVFSHTAAYDSMISDYLAKDLGIKYPDVYTMAFEKAEELRYGENPHQSGALYRDMISHPSDLVNAVQLNGKQLSYNNLNDANGALALLREFDRPAVVAVKHSNPCGVAEGKTIYEAYMKAYECDPVSIFGGIIALNRPVDRETAEDMAKIFLEIIIAPDYTDEALAVLTAKTNLRILKIADIMNDSTERDFKRINGGLILQSVDKKLINEYKVVTKIQPTERQLEDMEFGMKVVKHCKSNAIVVVSKGATLGIGIGQTNRIWATNQAIEHSLKGVKDAVMVSDAFFPFSDCVEAAAAAGISAVAHPGGSKNDAQSVEAADKYGMTMVMTGIRHFRH